MNLFYFLLGVLTLAGFYAILAMILNLVAGWGGMWDLGIAGLVAVGAYTFVITTQTDVASVRFAPGLPLVGGVVAASLVTGLVAFLIGLPALRLRGEYFLITTLAFAEVIRQLSINAGGITRGTVGFSQLDRPFSSLATGANYRFVLLGMVTVVAVLMYLLMRRIARSPYGRLLRAMRDNEAVALSLGKQVIRHRVMTFTFAGLLIGAVSPIYIWHIRSIVPQLFAAELTFVVWTALVIGGIGSLAGPVIGGLVLILLTELLTFLQGSAEYATLLSASRPIILGLLLILIMRIKPSGLIPERRSFQQQSQRGSTGGPPQLREDETQQTEASVTS
jgi:branched-chain amino acid transport system permease protein